MDEPLADELAAKEAEEPVTDLGPTVLLRRGSFWGGLLSWFLAACSLYLWLVMTIFGLVQASVEESTFPLLFLLLAVVFFAYGWFNIFGRFDVRQHGLCYRKWGGPITVRNEDVVRIGYIVQRKALLGITLEVVHLLVLCAKVAGRDVQLDWRFTAQYPDEDFNQFADSLARRLAERWMQRLAAGESIEWLFDVHLTPAGLLQFDPMTPHDPAAMELTPYQEISRVDIGQFWCDVIRRDGTLLVQACVLEWDLLPGALLLKRLIEVPDVRRAAAASPTTASA